MKRIAIIVKHQLLLLLLVFLTLLISPMGQVYADLTPQLLKDINPGPSNSNFRDMTNVNGTIFFTANDGAHGTELWKTDSTAEGTIMVKDITAGSASSYLYSLTNVNGTLFFRRNIPRSGSELWKSDGTPEGTEMVMYFATIKATFASYDFVAVGDILFFIIQTPTHNRELWKSDGTPEGTKMLKDMPEYSYITDLRNLGEILTFRADDGTHGEELWKSDGTPEGTQMVKDINPTGSSYPYSPIVANGYLFFGARTEEDADPDLWKSDGTEAGTTMVKEDVYPNEIVAAVGDIVYFTVRDRRCYLWKSDGTPAGTVMVANLFYCPYPEDFFATENLLFIANEGIDPDLGDLGEELWKSDGTPAGTGLVKDINPGIIGSSPDYFFDVNGLLYFTATVKINEDWPRLIWRSDGSEIGTRIVVPDMRINGIETVLGDTLFFRYDNDVSGDEPWMVTVEAIEDSDSDGIMDVVDGWWDDGPPGAFHDESGTFSDNFTDQHIDGKSFGFIQNRADHSGLIVTVDDAPNTGDGLLITASGDTTKAARIRICDLSPPGGRVELTNGDSIIVTCGSMEMQVLEGPVELFLNDDNVKVIAGASAIILVTESGDGQLQVENLSETVNITIEVEGVSVELGPADHLQSAAIDILPADTENCINTKKKGKIPVAIFGSSEFDVTLIDPATCLLEEDHGISTRGKAGTPMAGIEDVNLDGFSDLVLQFEVEGSTFAGKTAATVTCEFDAGQVTVSGYDAICIVP